MATSVQVKIDGLKPFLRRLRKIEKPRRRASILKQALNAGMAPIKTAMRRQIRGQRLTRKGHMLKAVASKVKEYPVSGNAILMAGMRDKKTDDGENPAKYFHLVDLGTHAHVQPSRPVLVYSIPDWRMVPGGFYVHPGARPHPIREPAMKAVSSAQITKKVQDRLQKKIAQELSRG